MIPVLAFLLAPVPSRGACDPPFLKDPALSQRDYKKLVRAYNKRTGAKLISVERLKKWIAGGRKLVLLDIRPRAEHEVSTLAGARQVYPTRRGGWPELQLPADAEVVAFCSVGYRAGWAARAYGERTGRKIRVLDGGIIAWFNAGGTVVDQEGRPVEAVDPFTPEFARFVRR